MFTCVVAHISNLIVRDGLKDKMDFVCKIRVAFKYVISSPSQLTKFKKCVMKQNTNFKRSCLLKCGN